MDLYRHVIAGRRVPIRSIRRLNLSGRVVAPSRPESPLAYPAFPDGAVPLARPRAPFQAARFRAMGAWACASCGQENPSGTRFCGHCGRARVESAPPLQEFGPAIGLELAQAPPDERRLITALFADISGFTKLAEQLDPEQLVEIVDPILRRMGTIVERYEGRVVKFAGDAVLAFFGAPVAHEDDALRALLCARDMQSEIAALVENLPPQGRDLRLHIGVNTGHVVTGVRGGNLDYSVLGDAVNVAQRLESAAGPGEILVGERTHALVGDALTLLAVGPIALKGKADPVPAWRVNRDDASAATDREVSWHPSELVGRRHERGDVERAWRAVAAGGFRTVAIVGEPGVGKTRLLQDAAQIAEQMGIRWLAARCLSYGSSLPYWPFLELLRSLAGIRPETPAPEAIKALGALTLTTDAEDGLPYLLELLGVNAPESAGAIPESIRRSPETL